MSEDKSKLQLIGEIAEANNKNLELIEEINEKEDEIERLNNIIKRLEEDLREMYLTFGEFSEEYAEKKIKELKGVDKE